MANKKIFEFPPLTFAELDNDLILWAVGNPETTDGSLPLDPVQGIFLPGQLFKVTIAQLKEFFANGGNPQSWQQVMDVSSTLNKDNTIAGANFDFFWNAMKHFINMTSNIDDALNAKLNIGVGTNELGIKITSSRNNAYYQIYDTDQAGNGGLNAINVSSFNNLGVEVYQLTGRWLQYGTTAPVQLSNGAVTVNNAGSTKSLVLQSNSIISFNDPLTFGYQIGATITEFMRMTITGQFAIGTAAPSASAKLQVDSTTQGFLLPRMTKAQRDAIASPGAGLMIHQTDNTPGMREFNGTNWVRYTETID